MFTVIIDMSRPKPTILFCFSFHQLITLFFFCLFSFFLPSYGLLGPYVFYFDLPGVSVYILLYRFLNACSKYYVIHA